MNPEIFCLKDAMMPEIKVGDTLAVLATGAYNYSMASNYNRNSERQLLLFPDGKTLKVVVKRGNHEGPYKERRSLIYWF